MTYYRPIVQTDRQRPETAVSIAGGWAWFDRAEVLCKGMPAKTIHAHDIPDHVLKNISNPRPSISGLDMSAPHIMGVLNVTPDSFSDGGDHNQFNSAVERAQTMEHEGASFIDIGGESTRPGADAVDIETETNRTIPVIKALGIADLSVKISIDTRNASVARNACDAGAVMFNDVTALTHDAKSMDFVGKEKPYVCLMHSLSDPQTMQNNPKYDDVLLDIYDYLNERIQSCIAAGLPKERIVIDPGIGFGKTQDHNLQLIRGLSVFHGLGCPILLGVSRKRFIGDIGDAQKPADRVYGSIAIALEGLKQGVQILRVHDVWQTRQAMRLWQATL